MARTGLQRLRLIGPAYRGYERWQAWWSARRRRTPSHGPDGLPFPPQRLVVLVAGPAAPEDFLSMGRMGADIVRSMVESDGARLEDMSAILDFGVGCGRVARHWMTLEGPSIHGCDINGDLVAWTDRNLPFVEARQSALEPPLPYEDAAFDLVYAFSVFTHLPEELQRRWIAELRRVLRPDGRLLLSTHGTAYLDRLDGEERRAFDEGRLVVQVEELAGANICNAFHPESYVHDTLAVGFEVRRFAARAARSNSHQDAWLLRRNRVIP